MDENLCYNTLNEISAQEYNAVKVVLVTGANSGVGLGAAQAMRAGRNGNHGMSIEGQCLDAAEQVNKGDGKGLAVPMVLDLASSTLSAKSLLS